MTDFIKQELPNTDSYQSNTAEFKNSEDFHGVVTPPELSHDYEFLEEIGSGSQGHIFKARDLHHNREVAVKKLSIGSVSNWKEYELFEREAKVLQSIDITGVAKFYETRQFLGLERPAAYIVQEYIHGESLAELIKDGYRFPIHEIYDIIIQLLGILEQLHHHDPVIIHRDIKPSNIMLCPQNGQMQVYLH